MSVLKIKSNNLDLELTLDGKDAACEISKKSTNSIGSSEAEIHAALVALALSNLWEGKVHDEESGVITIEKHSSEWTSKTFGFRNTTK